MDKRIQNALSFDVEDYFMVSAFEPTVPKSDWDKYENRVGRNTRKILSILKEFGVKGTFFTLGWVAERNPDLIREIHLQGHEVACHGYFHKLIYNQTREEFVEDVRKAKGILEKITGSPVYGYRAPSFSVIEETQWALGVIAAEGFSYDSSILPAPHARGGLPGSNRFPHRLNGLVEFPMSTMKVAGKTLPFSGGGYFRMFPYPVLRWGIENCNRLGHPVVTYLHPWEFDPDQPKMEGKWTDRFKHYLNLDKTEERFRKMLTDFKFGTLKDTLDQLKLPAF